MLFQLEDFISCIDTSNMQDKFGIEPCQLNQKLNIQNVTNSINPITVLIFLFSHLCALKGNGHILIFFLYFLSYCVFTGRG